MKSYFLDLDDDLTMITPYINRDNLIASVLDGVRASGNRDVCVKMTRTDRGQRQDPLYTSVDEEIESHHLKFLVTPPSKLIGSSNVTFELTH